MYYIKYLCKVTVSYWIYLFTQMLRKRLLKILNVYRKYHDINANGHVYICMNPKRTMSLL